MSPKNRAIIGSIFCLPSVIVWLFLQFDIDLNPQPLQASLNPADDGRNLLVTTVAFIIFIVLPIIALVLNIAPVRMAKKTGDQSMAHPGNMAVVAFTTALLTALIISFIVNQYP